MRFIRTKTLQPYTCVVEQIGCQLEVDVQRVLELDEAFFGLLRDKAAINATLRHIDGKAIADAIVSATARI